MLFMFLVGLLAVWFILPQKPETEMTNAPGSLSLNPVVSNAAGESIGYLPWGEVYAALDDQGRVIQSIPRESVLAGSSQGVLSTAGEQLLLHALGNAPLRYNLDSPSGAFWNGKSLYLFQDFGFSLSEIGVGAGDVLWKRSFTSPITALSQGRSLLAVGELGGKIHLIDNVGGEQAIVTPTGSRESVIYNLALSPEGDKLISISGVSPKRFIYWEKQGSELRAFYSRNLLDESPRPTFLAFDRDHSMALYQDKDELVIRHFEEKRLQILPVKGEVHSVRVDPITQNYIILQRFPQGGQLDYFSKDAELLSRSLFGGKLNDALWTDRKILLSLDQGVYALQWDYGKQEAEEKPEGPGRNKDA
jgi:hypothetical protein